MASRDSDGLADPFLVVSNGRAKHNIIDDVRHVQLDTLNPNFYRCYELPTLIPGNPTLTIEVWDKDSNGAQLIGKTSIDIESRLLSQEWLEMIPKPVERRYIWSPASLAPQGKLEMWVEILTPPQALASKPKVLRAPAALECQLRVVVWGVHELEIRGKSTAIMNSGTADVFVTVQAGQGTAQESDTHNGCVDHAEFNWRYLFDVHQPTRYTKLTVQVWDARNTGANDALAECTLQLAQLYTNVQLAQRVHEVPRQLYVCSHPLYSGPQAKIDMSISMMPQSVADQLENIAGMRRDQPNKNPYLPPPERAPQVVGGRGLVRGVSSVLRFAGSVSSSTLQEAERGFDAALKGQSGLPRPSTYPRLSAVGWVGGPGGLNQARDVSDAEVSAVAQAAVQAKRSRGLFSKVLGSSKSRGLTTDGSLDRGSAAAVQESLAGRQD